MAAGGKRFRAGWVSSYLLYSGTQDRLGIGLGRPLDGFKRADPQKYTEILVHAKDG